MAVKIQLRRGTAAEWTAANPILAEGEVGLELDTNSLKFGDGTTEWDELDYVVSGGGVTHERGEYDLSTEAYPSSGGTGVAGVPAVKDWWYGINSGDFDVEDLGTITLNRGALLIYIGGTVSDASSWIVKQ